MMIDHWLYVRGVLYGGFVTLGIIVGISYILQGKRKDDEDGRTLLFGIGGSIIGTVISRLFFILRYEQFVLDLPGGYQASRTIMHTWSSIALFILLYAYERVYKRTRYLLSAIPVVFITLYYILPNDIGTILMNTIGVTLIFILEFMVVVTLTRSSRRELKTLGSLVFFGIYLAQQGVLLDGGEVLAIPFVDWVIGPLITSIGLIILYIPMKLDYDKLKQPVKFWTTFGIGTLSIHSVVIFAGLYLQDMNPAVLVMLIILLIALIFIFIQAIKDARVKGPGTAASGGATNFLGMFERPKKVTEEEVSVSKEKKVCLVCKGSGLRFTYICPECNSIYCQRCATTLAGMENACWACNAPFDEAKPVRLEKEGEDIVGIHEKAPADAKKEG
ncbi:MAG: hypothetical protein ACFFCS_17165 [Candidatus Hodarchaeota archaeon]